MSSRAEQKANLLKAIDRAKGCGDCLYVADNKPHCVIAQLAFLEGVGISKMERADFPELIEKYGLRLLRSLQEIWDAGRDPVDSKSAMRELIEAAYAE